MAKFFTTCTYPNALGLLSLTVCVMLATSAPTVHVRQVSRCVHDRRDIYYDVTTLVSSNILCPTIYRYCVIGSHALLVHSVMRMVRIVQCFLELSEVCVR